MEIYILVFLSIVLFSFNTFVSFFIFKRDDLDSFQKKAQVFCVWLFPFIGGIGFYLFHQNSDKEYETSKKFGGGSGNDNKQADGGVFNDI